MKIQAPSTEEIRNLVSQSDKERFDRGHNVADPMIGLDELHRQLVDAARAYEAGPQNQRQAICDSIMAVSAFFEGQGFGSATMVPLSRVVWAIVDLCEHNHPDPLFCEKPKKSKPRRDMENAVRQGHLAALADFWLKSCAVDVREEKAKLQQGARLMSGPHFGMLDGKMLSSARSYQRQIGQPDLVYQSYEQMSALLQSEADALDCKPEGFRIAVETQIKALNEKALMRRP